MTEPKKITKGQYLQAFALFTMANRRYLEGVQFEEELAKILGYDSRRAFKWLADGLYEEKPDFDLGLKEEGFEVEGPEPR